MFVIEAHMIKNVSKQEGAGYFTYIWQMKKRTLPSQQGLPVHTLPSQLYNNRGCLYTHTHTHTGLSTMQQQGLPVHTHTLATQLCNNRGCLYTHTGLSTMQQQGLPVHTHTGLSTMQQQGLLYTP